MQTCIKSKAAGISKKQYSFWRALWQVVQVSPIHFVLEYAATLLDGILLGLVTVQMQKVFDAIIHFSQQKIELHELIKVLVLFSPD